MNKELYDIGNVHCVAYIHDTPGYRHSSDTAPCAAPFLLVQPVDTHDLETLDNQADVLTGLVENSFVLAAFKVNIWRNDLSPWNAPAVYGNDTFGAGASSTLNFITEKLIPFMKEKYHLPENTQIIAGGYSLAALFALWSAYQTNAFDAIAAASPSVWFRNWTEYAEKNRCLAKFVYLSIGDREAKTGNSIMASVEDRIKKQQEILVTHNTACVLEWNRGGHFNEPDIRCAKAFAGCIKALSEQHFSYGSPS